ncbi:MAG: hypothetical protein HC808_09020 [Candidatus Competibacteraceae bacterium]|nr:hypothetical protein [Candidatus Competibacteraceae bacterium]
MYIFIDPYCRFCHQQWAMLRAKINTGQLRVRWVPVAVLSVSQRRLSTVMGLLNDPSPENLNSWIRKQQVQPDDSEAAKLALARNTVLFQALRVRSVPALIYKNQAGELVKKAGVTAL